MSKSDFEDSLTYRRFTKERADSMTSSNLNLNSRRNSMSISSTDPYNSTTNGPEPETAITSGNAASIRTATPVLNGFDSPASKPRLVGLSQPFFAASPPIEPPNAQLEVMERAAAEASKTGDKVRVLVAEDNIVNQEVVLRMLKLEDIYGTLFASQAAKSRLLIPDRCHCCERWAGSI